MSRITICKVFTLLALVSHFSSADAALAQQVHGLIAIDKIANRIRFYDPRTLEQIFVIEPPEKTVHELALSVDRHWAYVPLYGEGTYGSNLKPNNKILVINLLNKSIEKIINLGDTVAPHGLVATRNGKLWVVCDQQNRLLRINPSLGTIEVVFQIPGKGAHFLTLLPNESHLVISNKEGPIEIFNLLREEFTSEVHLKHTTNKEGNGSGFEGLVATPDSRYVLVADNLSSSLHMIDVVNGYELKEVKLRDMALSNPRRTRLIRLVYSPNGRFLVVAAYVSGQVWLIDPKILSRQRLVSVAKGPQGIAFSPFDDTVIVSSHDSGQLALICVVHAH